MNLMTENRLARRASMMETARQMIAEKGYESITVRELAAACRVSVPTLYNPVSYTHLTLPTTPYV